MNIYKILYIFVLCCVIYEGVAWLGRRSSRSSRSSSSSSRSSSGSSSSPSRSSSRRSSNGNSRSNSNSGGSGWWGGRRNSQSKPSNPSPTSKTKPKPPTSKPQGSGNKGFSWFWGGSREQNRQSKSTPTPKPKPTTPAPKPHGSGNKGSSWFQGLSRWWSGWRRNRQSKPSSPFPKPKPKPTTPAPKPYEPKSSPSESNPDIEMENEIKNTEALSLTAYDAQPNNKNVHDTTIGWGFNMNRADAEEIFKKALPDVVFGEVKSGKQSITNDEADALFHYDFYTNQLPKAKRLVGEDTFNNLPPPVQRALVNAAYRGDLTKETAELMKEGKWEEAGKKYLDHYQYKNADELGIPGIKTRMYNNKKRFDIMIEPKEPKKNF